MKKLILFFIVSVPGMSVLHTSAYAQTGKNKISATDTVVKKVYTCPMHPEVISDRPGKCPKCGMELVEKKMPAKKKQNMKKDQTQ
jgi:hypothetical protein